MDEIERFIHQRDKALANLDMEYARRMIPLASSDEVRLIAMHKARYEAASLAPELRHESGQWLRERGYKRGTGGDLLPEGRLPGQIHITPK